MNLIQKLIGEAEDFSEYADLLALDAEQEKTQFNRPVKITTPEEAYFEAERLGNGNVPAWTEKIIAEDALYSYMYARDILHKSFPLGELAIADNAGFSYAYAVDVLKARFPLGEPAIITSAYADQYNRYLKTWAR